MGRREIALRNEILRGIVGSTAHGINIGGQDDRDEMGIFIEPPNYVCGLSSCDHYIYRTQPEGVRSGPGDLDLTLYSLRKFCGLAAKGNPSVLILLWLPEYLRCTPVAERLIEIRQAFVSQKAGERFLGYLTAQKKRLKGELSKNVSRPDLVEAYGFDTKFAMHALRLGLEGLELMNDGTLTLPAPEPRLSTLRAMRTGQIPFGEAVSLIEETEKQLRAKVASCTWRTDYSAINDFLVRSHLNYWPRP